MQANDRGIRFSEYDSTENEQLSYLNADSPHKLCCNCRAHNKNIITHSILSPTFVMVRSGRKILGLSPKGKVMDFDSIMCGFESH